MGAINNDKAMKSILEGVDYMIKKAIKDAPSDKIYVATVLEAKNNNLYKIQLKDKIYDNIPSLFQDIIQNEPVRVVVPQNNYNQMFILGKHNMDMLGDYNNLKNKPQINGVELKGNKTAKDLGLVAEAMIAELYIDKEFKAGEYTIYKGEMYKAKKDTKITIDDETRYAPPYDTDYWEKIPNVMSQIVAFAKMYNDFDNYTKGDYAMYDGDVYKLIEDNNDSTGIFYPYRVSEDEGVPAKVSRTDGYGNGFDFVTYKGTGALVWYTVDNRPLSDNINQWVMVSQDPNFTIVSTTVEGYYSEWLQSILNDPTHPQYDYYVKRVYIGYDDVNHYKYTLDNGEVWYVCFAYGRIGWDVEPDYSKGSREYGIHIPVDRDVWYYRWPDGGTVATRDFLEYILSIIITKGAKQSPTNSNYWRKVGYLMDEVTDYNNLKNKPKINGHELIGDKSTADLEILPPIASKTQFGGVIVGDGINVDETGKISIDGDFLPTPTLDGNIMVVENEEWVQKPLEDAETDPTVPRYVKDITEEDIERWNQGGGSGSGLPTPTAKDNILVSTENNWEQKNISTSTIPSFTKAEYALLKDTIPTGTRFIITDDNEDGGIFKKYIEQYQEYSFDEQVIGKWTDDKTIYQRTYVLNNISTVVSDWTTLLTIDEADNVISTDGFVIRTTTQERLKLNSYYISTNTLGNVVRYYTEALRVWSRVHFVITIQYTKTDDVPLPELPKFDDSNIHSINEKCIGQWINGKLLYQKTYELNIDSNNFSFNIDVDFEYINYDIITNNANYVLKDNYNDNTDNLFCYIYVPNKTFIIKASSYYFGKCYVTIQYTKTTD